MGRSRAADLGLGPLLGGGPASRRGRPDDTSRRHVVGSTGARLIKMRRSPPEPGSSFNGTSRVPAASRELNERESPMFEYKIHTQRDKIFSGAFDPTEFEAAP